MHHMILRVRRKFFEITTFFNSGAVRAGGGATTDAEASVGASPGTGASPGAAAVPSGAAEEGPGTGAKGLIRSGASDTMIVERWGREVLGLSTHIH